MSTYAPFGLRPNRMIGGSPNALAAKEYRAPNSVTVALAAGDPVRLIGGVVVANTSGDGNPQPLGVAVGFEWIDPLSKQHVIQKYMPAGTSSFAVLRGDNRPVVLVADDPRQTFVMQATATVTQGDVGLNFNVTVNTADALLGRSRVAMDVSSRGGTLVRLVGLAGTEDVYGSPTPLVEVQWVQHRHTVVSAN